MNKLFRAGLLLTLLVALNSCHVARYFYWNFADIDDYQKFENAKVPAPEQTSPIPEKTADISLPSDVADHPGQKPEKYLENHETVAFLLLKHDTIIYEKYLNGYTPATPVTSFSVAKSFVSALTGIAIDEGYIDSVKDPVIKYLPYLDSSKFAGLTLEHLLNMRSGIKFNEGYYNPFGDVAKYYYGRNLKKYLHNLKKEEEPGRRYAYKSVNTQILGAVIEEASGYRLQEYMEEKLWHPLGTKDQLLWSLDSRKHNTVKAYCCLNARARDFARFGRLYLHKGSWKGRPIVPAQWVERSTSINKNNRESQGYYYTYQWRITDYGAFFAQGIKGQYIYVWPEKDMVVLRFGKGYDDIEWPAIFKKIVLENE